MCAVHTITTLVSVVLFCLRLRVCSTRGSHRPNDRKHSGDPSNASLEITCISHLCGEHGGIVFQIRDAPGQLLIPALLNATEVTSISSTAARAGHHVSPNQFSLVNPVAPRDHLNDESALPRWRSQA